MPDWQKLVSDGLHGLALDTAEREEVHAELANHLEEICEGLLRMGMPEDEAVRRTLSHVENWHDLRRKIQSARRKENNMSNRVRQLWLPGLLTLFTSMSLLVLIDFLGPQRIAQPTDEYNVSFQLRSWSMIAPVMIVYGPWLLGLLLIGAAGAYLSHRAGASQRVVLLSILFPVLPYLVFFLIGLPLIVTLNQHTVHEIMFSALFIGLLAWVLFPAAALLAGGRVAQLILSRCSPNGSLTAR